MALIVINVPDEVAPRVVNAIAETRGYRENITNEVGEVIPNPQSKQQFAKQVIIDFIKQIVRNYEADRDALEARNAATTKVESEVTLS